MRIEIHSQGFELTAAIEEHVRRRIIFACDWAQHAVSRISVRLSDENGPRGGLDKRCTIVVWASGISELVIEDTRGGLFRAVDCASDRLSRNLSRKLARSRERAHIRPALASG